MHARHGTGVTVKEQLTGASSLPFCHVSPGIELRLSGLVAGAFDTKPAEALKLFPSTFIRERSLTKRHAPNYYIKQNHYIFVIPGSENGDRYHFPFYVS